MIPLPTFKAVLSKGVSGFDPDYQAILTRATALGYTLPDAQTQVAGNNLVVAMKSAGIWSKLDIFYVYATTGDQNFALLNWKNPLLYQCTLFNTFTFRARGGFLPTAATSYISTNWIPPTNGVQYTQNDASRFSYITTSAIPSVSPSITIDGNTTANNNRISNSATTIQRINGGATFTVGIGDFQGGGLKTITRSDANTVTVTSGTSYSLTDTPNASSTMSILTQFVGRSASGYSSSEFGAYGAGSQLTGVTSQLDSAIKNYFIGMGTTLDPDYQAIINRATSLGYALPSAYCQIAQNDMVVKMKSNSVWSKLDTLYVFDNDASTIDFASLNWKNPNAFQATMVNSPTWVPGEGITINASQYIDTNWNPTLNAVQYTLDNAMAAVRTNTLSSGNPIGTTLGTTGGLHITLANNTTIYLNTTNNLNTNSGASTAHLFRALARSSSTAVDYRAVSSTVTSVNNARTATSTAMPNNTIWIGRSGITSGIGSYQYAYFGAFLTASETGTLNSILMSFYGAR